MSSLVEYLENDNKGPSPGLWKDVDVLEIIRDPNKGFFLWDDFVDGFLDTVKWDFTNATAGTGAVVDGEGGILEIDSNSTTQNQGGQIQTIAASFLPAADNKIYFECRAKVTDTIADCQIFMGLAEDDDTIIASGANSTANHLGFEANTLTQGGTGGTASTLNFYGEKAGTRNTAAADVGLDVHLLVEDTYAKFGFIVDGVTNCKVYINGVHTNDVIPTANVPAVVLSPSFVCQTDGTSDPILSVDWVRCVQVGR